ncbi:hypothetical protein HETIRDRAFT_428671 [Heterobasidion irregulare TC 32-1]|uniref:Uncharacterized protein n=1 Tax=Heterobasidion irregulare (strain TC 32-1) TaxID=747525 RepID=W4K1E7_HETIT|nr:uncharacterized protein HETIRDRAFT_428671 [Heterobasidion irregulare TC 32-1]ETW78906.1 hypothetical protein HETIRDRAFT_428671 [Heterobasidion irregulare TC 32-1]
MAHINNIDPNQVTEWEHNWTLRFLAIPFKNNTRNPSNHSATAELIQNMVREATGISTLSVAAPVKSYKVILSYDLPNMFLVYKLTPEAITTMIENKIWETEKLTFYAIPLDPTILLHLFALGGFTTIDTDIVQEVIRDHWIRETMLNQIARVIDAFTETTSPISEEDTSKFIDSLMVKRVDTKASEGVLMIRFTIFTDGTILREDTYWYKIWEILSKISYTSYINGTGMILEALHCNICHVVDHPRGLCPFPNLPG